MKPPCPENVQENSPWYSEGLRFTCQQCGRCCRGEPGFVWVDRKEIKRISRLLKISEKNFLKNYCRKVGSRISLIEYDNGDCVFYSPEGCNIYSVRPVQCQTFPFWPHVIHSQKSWDRLKKRCPGIGKGQLYSAAEIARIAERQRSK